jgi:hypothetical protein
MSSDYFIGRGEELQKLMSGLTKSGKDAVAQPQVIHGGGGTGKSRLAIQAAVIGGTALTGGRAWLLYLEEKCDMAVQKKLSTSAAGRFLVQVGNRLRIGVGAA